MKITVKRYDESIRNAWNDFNKNAVNSLFMFDRNFMEYHKDRFVDYSLVLYDDNGICAILPASIHGTE